MEKQMRGFASSKFVRGLTLFACLYLFGCGGETNSGINCRFGVTEHLTKICVDNQCACRLALDVQNLGTLTVSGTFHYDAFDANDTIFAYTDISLPLLRPGEQTQIQNDLRFSDNKKLVRDCENVAKVLVSTNPTCP